MSEKLRWTRYPLAASERPKFMFTYYATGWGDFPFDMLRYDSAWPGDSEAASRMSDPGRYSKDLRRNNRSVKLHSYREPTIARWASFGWSVGMEDLTPPWKELSAQQDDTQKKVEPFKDAGDMHE